MGYISISVCVSLSFLSTNGSLLLGILHDLSSVIKFSNFISSLNLFFAIGNAFISSFDCKTNVFLYILFNIFPIFAINFVATLCIIYLCPIYAFCLSQISNFPYSLYIAASIA